jgi:hypothetical protein
MIKIVELEKPDGYNLDTATNPVCRYHIKEAVEFALEVLDGLRKSGQIYEDYQYASGLCRSEMEYDGMLNTLRDFLENRPPFRIN